MAASEAAVTAVADAQYAHQHDKAVKRMGGWTCRCGEFMVDSSALWQHIARAAADAAVDADRASIQAETLREFAERHRRERLSIQEPIWPSQLDLVADWIEGKP